MKLTTTILSLFIALFTYGQDTVAIGEYQWGIIKDGEVWTPVGGDGGYTITKTSLTKIKQGDGAQYTTIWLDSTGRVFILNGNSTTVTERSLTTANDTLRPDKVYGYWRAYFALKDGEIWYLAPLEDELLQNGGDTTTKWMKLTQPSGGKTITKIVSGATTGFSITSVMALCSDSTVFEYSRASTTPTQLTWTGGNSNAIDIAVVGAVARLIITPTEVHTKGFYASIVGGTNGGGSFEDVSDFFAAPVRPWRKIVTTYNSVHIIDANWDMWAGGNNMQGILGTGDQHPSWRTYWYGGNPSPYLWSWANGERHTAMTKIQGAKVTDIVAHNTVVSYVWTRDAAGNWYTHGRNKAQALANGLSLTIADQAAHSEWLNIPAPRNVYPLALSPYSPISSVDTAANRLPIANAGINQYIDTTATTLYGNGSHQQQPTTSTTVTMTYAWTQISGAACTITSPTSQSTTVTGLTDGDYVFRNTVTSSHGSDYDEVLVQVSGSTPPVFDYDTTINSWNAIIHLPDNYFSSSDSFPMIVFFPGLGEVGTDISDLRANGVHKYIEDGSWNGNVTVDAQTVKFIVVSIQPPTSYPNTSTIDTRIQTLLSTYRANKLHLTGLSHGSWCASTYVADYPNEVTSIVNVQGVQPFNTVDYVSEFTDYVNAGGKYLGIEQVSDFRDIQNLINALNSIQSGAGIYVQTNYGGGGHCCWGEFYGDADAPQNLYNSENIYQWMARFSLEDEPVNNPPVADAGENQTITLPTNSVTVNASGSTDDVGITSYLWTKTSGGTATITSPTSVSTTITGLVEGTYVFRVTVEDVEEESDFDEVTITVNPAPPSGCLNCIILRNTKIVNQ